MPRHKPDDLLSMDEVAEAIGRKRATVYNLARDHNLQRYRMPARGKTTFLRWGDVQAAMATPIPRTMARGPRKEARSEQ